MASSREDLIRLNLNDLIASLGCGSLLAPLLRPFFHIPARIFADQMTTFDTACGMVGELAGPARALLRKHYIRGFTTRGEPHLPVRGPALFLANHPGMTDTLTLIAAIGRPDLKIIAARRPFLEALPQVSRHIFFVDANLGRRVIVAHQVADHLKQGGAVLTFPAGCIEPDPDVAPGAVQSLGAWADTARLIARLAPETLIVPTLIRGVIWRKAARHWLTRLQHEPAARDKRAAALQLLAMIALNVKPTAVSVNFAEPLCAPANLDTVIGRMRHLLSETRPAAEDDLGGWPRELAPG